MGVDYVALYDPCTIAQGKCRCDGWTYWCVHPSLLFEVPSTRGKVTVRKGYLVRYLGEDILELWTPQNPVDTDGDLRLCFDTIDADSSVCADLTGHLVVEVKRRRGKNPTLEIVFPKHA